MYLIYETFTQPIDPYAADFFRIFFIHLVEAQLRTINSYVYKKIYVFKIELLD